MLTLKLMKYGPQGREIEAPGTFTAGFAIHSAKNVYLEYEKDGRAVLRFNEESVTVGNVGHTMYDVAYIMNDTGKTIDTIR